MILIVNGRCIYDKIKMSGTRTSGDAMGRTNIKLSLQKDGNHGKEN